jgi:hypothetical protein
MSIMVLVVMVMARKDLFHVQVSGKLIDNGKPIPTASRRLVGNKYIGLLPGKFLDYVWKDPR